jgi:hypothetical protein
MPKKGGMRWRAREGMRIQEKERMVEKGVRWWERGCMRMLDKEVRWRENVRE